MSKKDQNDAKLTDVQLHLLLESRKKVDLLKKQLEEAEQELNTVSALILDAHGFKTTDQVELDIESKTIKREL